MDESTPPSMDAIPPPPSKDTPKTDTKEPPKENAETEKKAVDETPPAKPSEPEEKKPPPQEEKKTPEPEKEKTPQPEEKKPTEQEEKKPPEPEQKNPPDETKQNLPPEPKDESPPKSKEEPPKTATIETKPAPPVVEPEKKDEEAKPEVESPKPKGIKVMKIVGIALFIVLLIYIGHSILYKPEGPHVVGARTINVSAEEISNFSVNYLSSIDKGDYPIIQACDKNNNCWEETLDTPQGVSWRILWYAGLYRMTGDEAYVEKINNRMEQLISVCNQTIKNCSKNPKGGDYCAYIIYKLSKGYEVTNNPRQLAFMEDLGVCLSKHGFTKQPMLEAIDARDMLILYRLSKTDSNFGNVGNHEFNSSEMLSKGKTKLSYAEKLYNTSIYSSTVIYKEGDFEFRQPACWIQSAKLEAYQATGNETYLNEVKDFFSKAKLDKHLFVTDSSTSYSFITPEIIPCIDSLQTLRDITGDPSYDTDILEFDNHLVNNYMDLPMNPIVNGDGGLFVLSKESNYKRNSKATSTNSQFTYLLSQQKNLTLSIKLDT